MFVLFWIIFSLPFVDQFLPNTIRFQKSPFEISKKAKQSIFVHTGFLASFSPDHTITVGDGTIERDLVLRMCEIIISIPIN